MEVTPSGILIEDRVVQLEKAELPMDVTVSGILREFRAEQPLKA